MASDWTLVATALIGAGATVGAVWLTQRSARKSAERVSADTRAAADRAAESAREQRAEDEQRRLVDERKAAAIDFLAVLFEYLNYYQQSTPVSPEGASRLHEAIARIDVLYPEPIADAAKDLYVLLYTGMQSGNDWNERYAALVEAVKSDLGIV